MSRKSKDEDPEAGEQQDKRAKGGRAKERSAKGRGARGKDAATTGPSVATHPRAAGQVRRAKGLGGLAGFAIAAYLSLRAGVPADQAGLRALAAGVAGYMLAWACAVTVWRHLVVAELRAVADRVRPAPVPEQPHADEQETTA